MGSSVGGSFNGKTTTVTTLVTASAPIPEFSKTTILTVVVPNSFGAGVSIKVRLAPLTPSTRFTGGNKVELADETETRRLEGSDSASATTNETRFVIESSSTVMTAGAEIVGASFTDLTLSVNVVVADPLSPSTTVTETIVSSPKTSAIGVSRIKRFVPDPSITIPPSSSTSRFDDSTRSNNPDAAVSKSLTKTGTTAVVSSSIAMVFSWEIVGRSLTARTVTVNDLLFVLIPSLTRTVTTAVPLAFRTGRNSTRPVLSPLP